MSAAELLKKMQKVREERALRASNASEQTAKVENTRLSETEKEQQEQRSASHHEHVLVQSQGEAETTKCQVHNTKEKINNEESLSMKKTGQLSKMQLKRHDEEEDLMLNVPPSFTSPVHVIPQYRNRTSDPLCAPFHADLAANMFLHELICQNVDAAALQQNVDNVKGSIKETMNGGDRANPTEAICENFIDIDNTQLPPLEPINRKRTRTYELEQDDQIEYIAHNTHLNHVNSSPQGTISNFDPNVLNSIRLLNSSLLLSRSSSSIAANYFSEYLTHKLNVAYNIASPLEYVNSKEPSHESQHHLHLHLDNNEESEEHFCAQKQKQSRTSQQQETLLQEGIDKNVCSEEQSKTCIGKQLEQQHEYGKQHVECKPPEDKNLQSSVNNQDHKLPWMSLYEDSNYIRDCQHASVHTHNLHACPCGDVNRYVRKDFIAHGVYGVVFSASKKVRGVDTKQSYESFVEQKGKTINCTEYVANGVHGNKDLKEFANLASKTAQKDQVELFAVKQIRKSRLAESREGFPTYLLREFDLLLRVRHPNIVEAQELVLLDPSPQLNLCHTCRSHKEERVEANEEATNNELLKCEEQEEEEWLQRKKEKEHEKHNQETEKEEEQNEEEEKKVEKREPQNADSSVYTAAATTTELDKSKEAVTNTNVVQTSTSSSTNLHNSSTKVRDVFLIMEYCPFDLKRYMFYYSRNANPLLPPTPFMHISSHNHHPNATNALISRIKCVIYQILSGLQFLHDHRILHRDLKTSNILLDQHGRIKLCDFGLARHYREGQRLTPTVVTLLYRAPERHFGVMDYSHKLDSWSAGCIFAELFLKEPLFRAETDMGHLRSICDVIGIPSEETFPGLYKLPAAKEMMRSIGRWNRQNKLAQVFANSTCKDAALIPSSALDLLNKLLEWNPATRLSAKDALKHAFFSEFPPPCAPSELLTPMPTLYSSSNQRSATEQEQTKVNEANEVPIAASSASLSTEAKGKYDANVDNGVSISKISTVKFDASTLAHSASTTIQFIIHNTINNNEEQCEYCDGKVFAPYNTKKNENKTTLEMEKDEENDMYCSPVDAIHEDSSHNATNSLKINNALYATNNNSSSGTTDPDSTCNNGSHNKDDVNDVIQDDAVIGIPQVDNKYNVELEREKEKQRRLNV